MIASRTSLLRPFIFLLLLFSISSHVSFPLRPLSPLRPLTSPSVLAFVVPRDLLLRLPVHLSVQDRLYPLLSPIFLLSVSSLQEAHSFRDRIVI